MADLGESSTANSSTAAGGPGHKRSSWVAVSLIIVGAVLLGFAFVMQNVPMAIAGGVLAVVGGVIGLMGGIMEDVH